MANPAWFFSTLSQATAAIVGLLVSARLIQYQLERQRRQRRTEDLRKEIQDFEKKFGHIIHPMAGSFADVADKSYFADSQSLSRRGDELNLDIAMNSSMPVATMYWVHFGRVAFVLRTGVNPSPEPEEHYLFSEQQFNRLRESIYWLKENVDERSMFIENLYADLDIQSSSEYTADVFDPDPPGESLQDWIQRHLDYATRHSSLISGQNLQSYQRVVGALNRDFQRLDSLRENTIITFNSKLDEFLAKSFVLLTVGVILPLAAVISDVPAVLSSLVFDSVLLYSYETVLLTCTSIMIWVLFEDLQQEFTTSAFGDSLASFFKEKTEGITTTLRISGD